MSFPSLTKTYRKSTYPAIDPQRPELSAKGKTVIITGAGAGSLGSDIALSFAKAGSTKIALVGRTEKTLRQTEEKIHAAFPDATVCVAIADVSKNESIGLAAHNIRAELGAWDVFVNGAGYLPTPTTMTAADEDEWWKGFEVTVKFVQLFSKHFLAKCRPNATYISINAAGSTIPQAHMPKMSAYSGAKIAAIKLDEYVAVENPSLRVFTLHPGVVETAMFKKATAGQEGLPEASQTDDPSLPADFCVWLTAGEADFLRGRFVWANWDVEELIAKKAELEADPMLLRLQIGGWPFA